MVNFENKSLVPNSFNKPFKINLLESINIRKTEEKYFC